MNLKKVLVALSLCIVMVLALFAYDMGLLGSVSQASLYGTWLTDIPAAEQVEQSLAQLGIEYDIADDLMMTYQFEYRTDGTVTVSVDPESARHIVNAETEALRICLPELLYDQYLTQANMSREETDALLIAQGLTMDDLVEMALEQVDLSGRFTDGSMTYTQYYCVQNGNICYAISSADLDAGNYDMTVKAKISGKTMVLSDAFDGDGNPFAGSGAVKYPMTLRKK